MKRLLAVLLFISLLLCGCVNTAPPAQIAATTLPVYEFTVALCRNTPLTVTRLVTEEVSCLHDYSLNVHQVKAAEAAELIVISGAGLEEFLDDLLLSADTIDASANIPLLRPNDHSHDHGEDGDDSHDHENHHHDQDPHIWLSPANAMTMAENICDGLEQRYPQHGNVFRSNLEGLLEQLSVLEAYGQKELEQLSCREIITFHDGFSYFAHSFHLTILEAIEEESGSEASAKELIHMIEEVEHHQLPAIFTEKSGSVSAAGILSRETGAACYTLDMAMAGDSYFDAMYHNIDTIREALK